jgi:hypothetical protein
VRVRNRFAHITRTGVSHSLPYSTRSKFFLCSESDTHREELVTSSPLHTLQSPQSKRRVILSKGIKAASIHILAVPFSKNCLHSQTSQAPSGAPAS